MPKASEQFESVSRCDLCGSNRQLELYTAQDLNQKNPGVFHIVKCQGCGLVFVNPRPKPSAIGAFYPEDYWRPLPDRGEIESAYGEIFGELAKLKPGRMLDIGTGGAYFLSLFDKWQRVGTELSPAAADRASKAYRFPVYPGLLEEIYDQGKLADSSFDLITLNHVVEHLYSPRRTLSLAHKLLKPGGKLMVSTPNFKSFTQGWTKDNWYHLDPPRHLYLFTPHTLRRLLSQTGFHVDKITYDHKEHNKAGYTISFRRQVNHTAPPLRKAAERFIHATQNVMPKVLAQINSGDVMAAFATKES